MESELVNMTRAWKKEKKKSPVAQWTELPTGVREVMGSIPVGDSEFFFFSLSHARDMLISSLFTKKLKLLRTARRRAQKRPRYVAPGTDCSPGS